MTDEQITALKAAAKAATPQNIDTAESVERLEGGYIQCPTCHGEGDVEIEADYCNYDNTAIGVQFYGIGPEHGAAEAYFRAASPANVLALIERLERAESALLSASIADTAGAKQGEKRVMNGRVWVCTDPDIDRWISCGPATPPAPSVADASMSAEPIGEVRENGVTWFKQNPHAFPEGTKFYAEPIVVHVTASPDAIAAFKRAVIDATPSAENRGAPSVADAAGASERIAQLESALSTALAFIDDATIEEGQWHWLDDVRAAVAKESGK
ncbi:hypothetical protein QCE49_27805 [Caballeronia sp. LZ008]|uniref:hypothetical protein n=1 Tax=unclassified Caballeronia TaxID=2646786 RepID=UPI002028FE8A|nr:MULTISPECIES: hypothetical protein [unclassified Caballeronia]MDR5797206.1 hypothetical protein [Caballeronia sp. LZ008]